MIKNRTTAQATANGSTVVAWIAAAFIVAFLWLFFKSSISDPDLSRTELSAILLDDALGLGEATSDPSHTIQQSGLKYLPQRLPLFGTAALILVLAAIYGDAVYLLTLRRHRLYWTEQIVIRFGAGLGILSTGTLFCGLAGQLNRTTICMPVIASLVVAVFLRWQSRGEVSKVPTAPTTGKRTSRIVVTLSLLFIVPIVIYLLLGSVSPPTDFDVLEYHLQGPKEWFQTGQITFLRHNVYTSFPFLTEMLSLTGMVFAEDWWHGALVGQIVLASFQILSALSVFSIARRWISIEVAWLATLIYLTTPWTLRISLIAYAEGGLTFYLIASVMMSLLIREIPQRVFGASVLCGVFAGCAMATKYTGLISVILPTAVLIAARLWRPRDELLSSDVNRRISLLRVAAAFSLGAAIMILPWLLKNLAETGNPVYPLAYGVFGGNEWTPDMNARWKPAHAASEHDLLRIPEHILGAAVYNKWTSGLLFALSIPAVLLWRRNKILPVVFCLLFWGFATWWGFTHRIDRFWIPLIPLLSLAAGTAWLISGSKVWKAFLLTVIFAVTVFNVRFCGTALVGFHVGLTDLDVARQTTIRSDIRFLNDTLPKDAKVLMVGEAEVFDAAFSLVYNTVFDDCLFEEWTTLPEDNGRPVKDRRMLPPKAIRDTLAAHGITHVVVNWGEILRYRMPGSYGFTIYVQPFRFDDLVKFEVLGTSKILLSRPWDSLSATERKQILSWPSGNEYTGDNAQFAVVEVYRVLK